MSTARTARTVHTVSELAEILRALVEDSLPRVWVEGEVSNFSRPASGHWYFTLKDAGAQIRCAMFRNANHLVRPQPANGDRVLLRAQVSFYTARGDLQLIAEHLEPAGTGALLRAFEDLKRRLLAEGLFDAAQKRTLPALPRRIGLVTSATGAAVQDVLATFARRFPLLAVDLWPVPVQGEAAAPAIVKALRGLPERAAINAILLVRGGGSLEDLWAFNEESVARAIRACPVPVVTGVGHETDTTIADFAADLRAPTPTAAAERVSPDGAALAAQVQRQHDTALAAILRALRGAGQRLRNTEGRVRSLHPERAIRERAQRLDDTTERLALAMRRELGAILGRLRHRQTQLAARSPAEHLRRARERQQGLAHRLDRAIRASLAGHEAARARHAALLGSLNPQAVLDRGYAIAREASGGVVRDAREVPDAAELEIQLARGALRARRVG